LKPKYTDKTWNLWIFSLRNICEAYAETAAASNKD